MRIIHCRDYPFAAKHFSSLSLAPLFLGIEKDFLVFAVSEEFKGKNASINSLSSDFIPDSSFVEIVRTILSDKFHSTAENLVKTAKEMLKENLFEDTIIEDISSLSHKFEKSKEILKKAERYKDDIIRVALINNFLTQFLMTKDKATKRAIFNIIADEIAAVSPEIRELGISTILRDFSKKFSKAIEYLKEAKVTSTIVGTVSIPGDLPKNIIEELEDNIYIEDTFISSNFSTILFRVEIKAKNSRGDVVLSPISIETKRKLLKLDFPSFSSVMIFVKNTPNKYTYIYLPSGIIQETDEELKEEWEEPSGSEGETLEMGNQSFSTDKHTHFTPSQEPTSTQTEVTPTSETNAPSPPTSAPSAPSTPSAGEVKQSSEKSYNSLSKLIRQKLSKITKGG